MALKNVKKLNKCYKIITKVRKSIDKPKKNTYNADAVKVSHCEELKKVRQLNKGTLRQRPLQYAGNEVRL